MEPLTTPFHSPAPRFASYDDPTPDLKYPNPNFTSYVQYRVSLAPGRADMDPFTEGARMLF